MQYFNRAAVTAKAAVFDLDGTLIDSLEDLADSVNEVLTAHGYPTFEVDLYRYKVGNGSRKLIERALPEDKAGDEQLVDALQATAPASSSSVSCRRTRQGMSSWWMHFWPNTRPVMPKISSTRPVPMRASSIC